MSEGELLGTIKNYLIGMKSTIDSNEHFEINTEQTKEFYFAIATILTLKEKQQKEIEELKEMKPLQDLIDTNIIIADYSHNYISKDKIREKIKYIKTITFEENSITRDYILTILEELLEEK